MSEEPTSNETFSAGQAPAKSAVNKRSYWLPVFVLLMTFLVGFAPMWLKSNQLARELSRAQRELRLDQIQVTLANAALDARRGDYEPARQETATFFTLVNAELERGLGSALPAGASEGLKAVLAQRDDLITLLARGDPASAERLGTVYAAFQKAIGK